MQKLHIDDVVSGQILASDVTTPKGQLIASKGKVLNAQLLLHMKFYHIDYIYVEDQQVEEPKIQPEDEFLQDTMSWKLRHSKEFEEFKNSYNDNVEELKSVLSDFFNRQKPLVQEELLNGTKEIFAKDNTNISILNMMLNMREIDDSTYAHCVNVAVTSRVLGMWANLSPEDLDVLTVAGLCHDIGKSVIPNDILNKPGKLTDEEFETMKKHPLIGYELLKTQNIDQRIKNAALQHHEKFDGSGYPFGLKGEDIDDISAIITIADIYDAMTAKRVYRDAICPFDVIAEFQRHDYDHYHPKYIFIFLNRIADSYVNAAVELSDNRRGMILMINSNELTRPLIKLENGEFLDLRENPDIYIKTIL